MIIVLPRKHKKILKSSKNQSQLIKTMQKLPLNTIIRM